MLSELLRYDLTDRGARHRSLVDLPIELDADHPAVTGLLWRHVRGTVRYLPWSDVVSVDPERRRLVVDALAEDEEDERTAAETDGQQVLLRRDIREAVDRFLHPLDLSNDVLLALRSWLNLRIIDDPDPGTACSFLLGQKLSAAERKSLGVYANLNRRNARTALSSLFVFCHAAGFRGVVTLIDHLETMANTARLEGELYYTRGKRDQSYEMLRQIIDESVHTPYFMLVLAGSSDPLGDTRAGFPSYPALWARIQNEISTDQVNRFADVIAMDTLWHNDSESPEHLAKIWLSHQPHLDETIAPYRSPDAVGLEWALARRVVLAALSARDTPLEEV